MTAQPPPPNDVGNVVAHDDSPRRTLIAFAVVAMVIPAALIVAGTIVQLLLLGSVPSEIAVHWNFAGEADRWAPAFTMPLMTAVIGLATIALITLPVVGSVADGGAGAVYRILAGISLGTSILLAVAMTASVWAQTGDGDVPILALVGGGAVVGIVVGTVGALLLPAPPAAAELGGRPEPLTLDDDEQAVWLRTTTASRSVLAITVAAFVLALLATVFGWVGGQSAGYVLGAAVVAVVVALASAVTVAFRVRVSVDGLEVRSLPGFPRFRIPLDDIVDVRVDADVRPIGDFGGYGIRRIGKRTGVVPRRGPGIIVVRTGGRVFGVVVDDAPTGAALLAALAERAQEVEQ